MSALVLDGVTKTRGIGPRAVRALRDVSLQIEPGEVVLLEGPSGSGKTTLMTVAAGLLTADSGSVTIGDTRIDTLEPRDRAAVRARDVGFVFQRANLLETLTVLENAMLAGAIAGLSREDCAARAGALLEELGIAELADRFPATLSGGQEHRAALARGLVHRPRIVLADEPTGNLDSESGRAAATALRELASRHGVAVLVATHDPRLREIADRVLTLVDGQLAPEQP